MKSNSRGIASVLCLALFFLFVFPSQLYLPLTAQAQQNAPQPVNLKVRAKNIGGALELTGDTLIYGDLKVYLPDDMAAGDTISGTVIAEPKGSTKEERAKNQDTLEGLVLEIGDQKVPASNGTFTVKVPNMQGQPSYNLKFVEASSNKELATTALPVLAVPQNVQRPRTVTANDFRLPTIGQQGRAVEIFGPFDGDFSNTTLDWSTTKSPDGANNTENDSGGFGLIAESPRKAVFRSPRDVTGPIGINLKEGGVGTTGAFRNIGVRLSAPKTNLKKGESTTVTVEVLGLAGILTSLPMQLDTRGAVNMDGGNFQNFLIPPTGLQPGGRFTLTRSITGQQPGTFSVTATVIYRPFDICLKDDSEGQRGLSWNTFTGDYIFTNTGPAGQSKPPGGTTQPAGINLTGTGKPAMKGCIITLSHNAPDRRVFAKLDVCTNTGEASVQTPSPKATFTVTDKSTADNTCAAAPPPR
ncbi:MAG TPA: hypothetical protein VF791_18365 [Pyrinomonadaceae bacterium]